MSTATENGLLRMRDLASQSGVSAATILGDGSVALILDVADMHRLGQSKKENTVFGAPTRARPGDSPPWCRGPGCAAPSR